MTDLRPPDEQRSGAPPFDAHTVVGGLVFMVSGASLVVHILTDHPLPAVLAAAALLAGVLAFVAFHGTADAAARWHARIKVGVVAGLVSTVAYDVSRWLIVEMGGFHVSPFKALPFFGRALLGDGSADVARQIAGVAFHLTNGVAFGIAYCVWFGPRRVWWGVAFALGLEAAMLTVYPGWLDIRATREFTQMTVLGHVVYGATLAVVCRRGLRSAP